MINNANLVNQSSGDSEYYTPQKWLVLTRELMGVIDLDPASNEIANKTVQARQFYNKENDGLAHTWSGKIWMNHPFHRGEKACPTIRNKCKKKTCKPGRNNRGHHIDTDIPKNADWVNKILHDYNAGHITEAVMICFNSTSEKWFWPLLDYPQFYPPGRVNYRKPNGDIDKNCTKGSVITYLGPNVNEFIKTFSPHGKVKITAEIIK